MRLWVSERHRFCLSILAETANNDPRGEMASVWYLGRASIRSISVSEWNAAGITSGVDGPPVDNSWNPFNGYAIPADQFTEQQLQVLEAQTEFDTDAPDGPRTTPAIDNSEMINMESIVELLNESGLSQSGIINLVKNQIADPETEISGQLSATYAPANVVRKVDANGAATPATWDVRLDENGDVDAFVLNGVDL